MGQARINGMMFIAALCIGVLAHAASAGATVCRLHYSVQGWSAFYKTATGSGTIDCDNGQSSHVTIHVKGGGITFGKMKITNGEGKFSDVADIGELYGSYASAGADAGMVDAAQAKVITKGTVSLALSGTGKGVDIGVDFGEFRIDKAAAPKSKKKK
jgi:hypothetical protein